MARASVALLLALGCLQGADAHGAVTRPSPRRLASRSWCPWCIGEHQPVTNPYGAVHRDAEPSSPCMGTSRADRAYRPVEFSGYSVVAEEASGPYVAGEPLAATIVLDADHNGDARWSFCPHSEVETEECFDREEHLLTPWTDVHSYWGEASTRDHAFDGQYFPQEVPLPVSMPTSRVTLRWQWVCKWTDEIFVSCIDVDVISASSAPAPRPTSPPTPAPTAAPPSPSPAPTWAPMAAPTLAPTPAPSPAPTRAPTAAPTRAPTPAPAQPPVAAPSPAPTSAPAPVSHPTPAPTSSPAATGTPAQQSCASEYQKCGGVGWAGPQCCATGLTCAAQSRWHSQCERDPYGGPCSENWHQCGGVGWAGPTCCAPGLVCNALSDHYSQCRPEGLDDAPSAELEPERNPEGGAAVVKAHGAQYAEPEPEPEPESRPEGAAAMAQIRGHRGGFLAKGPALRQAKAAALLADRV